VARTELDALLEKRRNPAWAAIAKQAPMRCSDDGANTSSKGFG